MINANQNLNIVRASAWYDLIATTAFITPWTASLCLKGFATLSEALALDRSVPTLDVTAMLFANLLGSVVVIWSLWRLRHPSRTVGLYDVLTRILFAVWQLFAVASGASFLILGFTVFEIAFAIAQSMPVAEKSELSKPVDQERSLQISNIPL
ncbi:hypothetical protein QN382_14820 [Pseudomonas sp. 10B1]|uniref:hypothetical protein n=1 Tax=unclassified Pseudomonas TaxID=196821 RepID=UPI002AB339E5|nr:MULTISPECIES: hypothetical protein [unclassified Pseudomonas]MDY7561549.1 hypothetical protein [Pseudomonas sp. AB6]MEA9979150.1 hypothetical protein [Pseudomonas sp. RTS4]MEA9994987.1 hypothetical protein [Pseudomonas sp. AA4]MEB0088193.1 hypothetical protein [Pseudomonas sp. RTI1]MEB0127067.1 hypothetical protein [Pseudomonas sp. CCC1.2]